MSEKIVRRTLESRRETKAGVSTTWASTEPGSGDMVFEVGDKVVVILESEYDRLKRLAKPAVKEIAEALAGYDLDRATCKLKAFFDSSDDD